MIFTIFFVIVRIFSNSLLNVFQKALTNLGQRPSIVNFYTYAILSLICIPLLLISNIEFSQSLIVNFVIMGFLGALGNYFIVKALSLGELSTLAPINSYKPVVALIGGALFLNEFPTFIEVIALGIIILGSIFILNCKNGEFSKCAILYRILALIFSATEAIFIKKIIVMTSVSVGFYLWCIAGCVMSCLFLFKLNKCDFKIKSMKYQFLLVFAVAIMQYSTNFVFERMNVAYALALFQLTTLVSVILGVKLFSEQNFIKKIIASIMMITGAIILILCNI